MRGEGSTEPVGKGTETKGRKKKWLSEEALQIAEKRKETKCKGEKERHTHLNAKF